MARSRNIKPGFYKNEDLAECSVWARLIFPGLWMLADREGRLEDRPKRIKAELLPFDSVDVEPLLAELHARGFLVRYENEDGKFIQISKFKTHQTPHYTEKPSAIKPPTLQEYSESEGGNEGRGTPGGIQENSRSEEAIKRGSLPPDSLNPDSLIPDSGIMNPDSPNHSCGERAKRASRLPEDFEMPEDWLAWALEAQPTWTEAHASMIADKFRDYWHAESTAKARKLDWQATWRNWVRNEGPMRAGGFAAKADGGDGRVFVVNGKRYAVLPNRNGERDKEHLEIARELGVSTAGKSRPELEGKLIDKLRNLSAQAA